MTAFSERLIKLRKQKGLSQEQLGAAVGVTRQTVSKWELGDTTPELGKLVQLSDYFQISVDELVGHAAENHGDSAVEINGMPSVWHYEYKSKRTLFGVPLVHINLGHGPPPGPRYHCRRKLVPGGDRFRRAGCGYSVLWRLLPGYVLTGRPLTGTFSLRRRTVRGRAGLWRAGNRAVRRGRLRLWRLFHRRLCHCLEDRSRRLRPRPYRHRGPGDGGRRVSI